MIKFCFIILSLIGFSIPQSYAQIYRWVDKDGQVHFTNNKSTIPADHLDQSQEVPPGALQEQVTHSGTSLPPSAATTEAAPTRTSDEHLTLQQEEAEIDARIAAAQEERQHYLKQLNAMRPAQMNALVGGGKRRRVVAWGRSLAAVERQLDALHEERQQVQAKLQALDQTSPPAAATDSQTPGMLFDKQGHTRAYWQRRSVPLYKRLQQAREQRQTILEQLSSDAQTPIGAQRGTYVLQLTHELEQVKQDLDRAVTDMQNLKQEAARAGAPAAWLTESY